MSDDLRDVAAILSAFRADPSFEGLGDQMMAAAVEEHGSSSVIWHMTGLANLILEAAARKSGEDPDALLREVAANLAQSIEDYDRDADDDQ